MVERKVQSALNTFILVMAKKSLLGEGNALSSASSMQIRSMLLVSTIPEVTVVIT